MACDNVDKVKLEKCNYYFVTKKLSNNKKYFEWVVSVTKEMKEEEKRIGELEKWLGNTGASCHVVASTEELKNQKEDQVPNIVVGNGKKISVKW